MSNFIAVDNNIGSPTPVSNTNSVQQFPLGKEINCVDWGSGATSALMGGAKFVYCQGSNVASIGQFVHISNGSAVLLASANSTVGLRVGVAAGVLSASNAFGWVQVEGKGDYGRGTNSSIAAGQPLYLAGTSGILISASAAGSRVDGIVCPVSYTSSQSAALTFQIYPAAFVRGVTALQ